MIRKLIQKLFGSRLVRLANIAEGVSDGNKTYLADAAQASTGKLVKIGSDASHVAVTTANTESPIGVCDDETSAAEDNVNVQLLGQKKGTILMRAHAAITAGDEIVPAAAGRIQTITGITSATVYVCGKALNAATTQDDLVEVMHCVPIQRVIA